MVLDVLPSANEHARASWLTVNVWPPIVSGAVRGVAVTFGDTVKLTEPAPLPLAGETLTHAAPLAAVQAHPAIVVKPTVPVPPAALNVCPLEPRLYGHEMVSWDTLTARPATVTVPVRTVDPGFAGRVRVTIADPLPLAGDTEIHAALLTAVHPQPASAVTARVVAPPAAPIDRVSGDTLNAQLWKANWFEGSLRPWPAAPTADTRAS
jgi:hypothetical protein